MNLSILGIVTTGMLSGQNQSGAVLTMAKLMSQTVGVAAGGAPLHGVIRLKVRVIGLRVRATSLKVRAIGPKDLMTGTNRNGLKDRTTGTSQNRPKDRTTGTNRNGPKDPTTGTSQNRPKDQHGLWINTRPAPGALGLLAILLIHGCLDENLRKIVLPCGK